MSPGWTWRALLPLAAVSLVLAIACSNPIAPAQEELVEVPNGPEIQPAGPPDECFEGMECWEAFLEFQYCDYWGIACWPQLPDTAQTRMINTAIDQMQDAEMRNFMRYLMNGGRIQVYRIHNNEHGDSHIAIGSTFDWNARVHLYAWDASDPWGGAFGGPQELLETICDEAAHIATGQDHGHPAYTNAFRRCMGIS